MPIPTSLVLKVIASTPVEADASLGVLAATARRSQFELHRAFRRVTGETPRRYAERVRLHRAAAELVTSDKSILEVGLARGFRSHEVFSRAFLRTFGMSPRAYRARGLVGTRVWATSMIARRHAEVVREAGPCIGLHHLSNEARKPMSVVVERKQLEPKTALVIRAKCKRDEIAATLGQCLPRVFAWCSQHGVPFAGPPFTRYLPSGPGLISLEAGLTIALPSKGEGDIVATELPGGAAAVAIHAGSYDTLADTHAAVEQWLDANKLEGGAPWETYLTDPGTTPDPARWRTEVVYPLR